ncbi:hypothetical protein U1Q18_034141 [Sarracenia purpurea var. burkii]
MEAKGFWMFVMARKKELNSMWAQMVKMSHSVLFCRDIHAIEIHTGEVTSTRLTPTRSGGGGNLGAEEMVPVEDGTGVGGGETG